MEILCWPWMFLNSGMVDVYIVATEQTNPSWQHRRTTVCLIFLVPGSGSTWALVHNSSSGSPMELLSDRGCGWIIQEGSILTCLVVEPHGTADWRACMWLSLTPWLFPSVVASFQDQLIPRESRMEAALPAGTQMWKVHSFCYI